ncbi:MAG: hypothetical protein Q8S02_15130 [Hydrogenophaga sp.]|nr:hypothetical protein [Hydrogenophaga sp.]
MGASELLQHLRGAGLILTVTAAGALHVAPREALTDHHRTVIRSQRDDLLLALLAEVEPRPTPPPTRRSGNPLMTPEQGDECHAGGWDAAEIDAFRRRQARFMRMGRTADDADHLAERLSLRDRQHDDRRLCLECAALADNGRCRAAARGRLPGADRLLKPVPTLMQRCPDFALSLGLT